MYRPPDRVVDGIRLADKILGGLWVALFVGVYLWRFANPANRSGDPSFELGRFAGTILFALPGVNMFKGKLLGFVFTALVAIGMSIYGLTRPGFSPTAFGWLLIVYLVALVSYCVWRMATWKRYA